MEQRENESLLEVRLEVSVVEGRLIWRGKMQGEPLNCRVNGSDLRRSRLQKVRVCNSSTEYKLPKILKKCVGKLDLFSFETAHSFLFYFSATKTSTGKIFYLLLHSFQSFTEV